MLNAIDVDRVRANTAREVNEEIDSRIDESIQLYRGKGVTDILQRLYCTQCKDGVRPYPSYEDLVFVRVKRSIASYTL